MLITLNPVNPNIKIQILIYIFIFCCPCTFLLEVVGRICSSAIRFIFSDHVHNSHMTTLAYWGEHLPFDTLLPLSSVIGHGGNRLTNVSTVNIPLVTE